jgi:riboflavin synthase
MFTGLIAEKGKLTLLESANGIIHLTVSAPHIHGQGLRIGDSVAVNGICLTVTALVDKGFRTQVMPETSGRTTLAAWKTGEALNLERALALGGTLDGHLVAGHVDAVAVVREVVPEGSARRITLVPPASLGRYIAEKGSVALDGVSLTVAKIEPDNGFSVGIIPHTLEQTTLANWLPGKRVNLEVDLIARYLERLSQFSGRPGEGLSLSRLAENGFL